MAEVRFVDFSEIKKYASKAAKERVSVKDTDSTLWIAVYDPELVGFGGLLVKPPKARIKGDWMLPEHRGKGYGHMMTEFRTALCKRNPKIKQMEAYSLHPHYYEAQGWTLCGKYAEGITTVRRDI